MKKKLFLLLLIVALAAFVFTGCTPPAEGEGEGEGEGEIEGVVVDIDGAVEIDGKTYVRGGKHDITVTFPAPVVNAEAVITQCSGDYSKGILDELFDSKVTLFPNADKTVWTAKGYNFVCEPCYGYGFDCTEYSPCCSSTIKIIAGECEGEACVYLPFIVDCEKPAIGPVEICLEDCTCEGCQLVFKGTKMEDPCGDCGAEKVYCADCCSGFAGWTIALYNKYPFDDCCDTPCAEPFDSGSGDCQIDWTSKCLTDDRGVGEKTLYALLTAVDNVGNKIKRLAKLEIGFSEDKCDYIDIDNLEKTSCYDTGEFVCNEKTCDYCYE